MSRYTFVALLAVSLLSVNIAKADEVNSSTSTEVNAPGYSSSSSTTKSTTNDIPSTVTRETTTVDSVPTREVTTSRTSRINSPAATRSTYTHRERKVVSP